MTTGAHKTTADRVLAAMADRKAYDIDALVKATAAKRRNLSRVLSRLCADNLIRRTRPGCYVATAAGVKAAQSAAPLPSGRGASKRPNPDSLRSRAWRAMRTRRTFTVAELICDTRRGNETAKSTIQHFCQDLVRAGYLQGEYERGHARLRSNAKRYRIRKDTGPLAPSYSRERDVLHDYNTGEDLQLSKTGDACVT